MTLSALIRKGGLAKAATAIRAIPATQQGKAAATVARIATVAIAKPTSPKTATAWRWLLHYPDSDSVEVRFSPEATHAEVLRDFPGAIAAEPIPDTPKRPATEAEAAELTALVHQVADVHAFTDGQRQEALEIALADAVAALECFRELAARC